MGGRRSSTSAGFKHVTGVNAYRRTLLRRRSRRLAALLSLQTPLPTPAGPLRPYEDRDRAVVLRSLAATLEAAYPGGGEWLEARLTDVSNGLAACSVVRQRSHLLGLTIQTPKGTRRVKLSTIWVAPSVRHRGVGARLIDGCEQRWRALELDSVDVTVRSSAASSIGRLLLPRGFEVAALERDRYGVGRDEYVLSRKPSAAAAPVPREWIGTYLDSWPAVPAYC